MRKLFRRIIKGWGRCPECGSSNVHNPYDYSYCDDCGATNG